MRPLTQLGYISEALAGLVSVRGVTVKQSVFKEQSYESVCNEQFYGSVFGSNSTSEVSIGDKHEKCEDAECVIIRDSSDS
jgi:hypothetical protein